MRRENSEEKFYCLAPWPICYPAARMRMHAFTSGLGSYRVLLNDLYRHTFFLSSASSASRDVLFLRRQSRTRSRWNLTGLAVMRTSPKRGKSKNARLIITGCEREEKKQSRKKYERTGVLFRSPTLNFTQGDTSQFIAPVQLVSSKIMK